MATFKYKALSSGHQKNGAIEAESSRSARDILRSKGLTVVSLVELETNNSKRLGFSFKRKAISNLELSLITRQFAILLNSGLSVEMALNALIEQLTDHKQKAILVSVKNEVLEGKSLAQAFASHPKEFPKVYCSLVHAAEQSGSLANVMTKLADHSDRTRDLTGKIMMALLYPAIVSVVAVIMVTALLVFVVPQVVHVFQSTKQQLPLITRMLISVSDGIRHYGIFVLLILIFGVIAFLKALKKEDFKIKFHRFLLKLPVAGKLLMNVDIARFTHILALLLSSGVPMVQALNAGCDTISNYMLKQAIKNAIQLVEEGVPLATALSKEAAFPPVVIHLIASGEKSGNLDHLLSQAGAHQELELSHRSQLLTGILEPALILVMGGIVLVIVIAIMLPILNMNKMVM